jgi:aromatase
VEIENRLFMRAAPAAVAALAAHVEEWPRLLPHYRRVVVLAERPEGRVVEMIAVRHLLPVPVRWRAVQQCDLNAGSIHYRHVGGVTRGMEVEWQLMPASGGTDVRIVHRFDPPWPWPGPWLARWLVCGFFVHAIADRTLAGIRDEAERQAATKGPSGRTPVPSAPVGQMGAKP